MLFSYKYYVTHITNDTRYVTANINLFIIAQKLHKVQILENLNSNFYFYRILVNGKENMVAT